MIRTILTALAAITIDPNDVNLNKVGASADSTIPNALKLVFAIAGAVAVLIVTIGGFRYVISQGNPQETAKAKDTIMYALIGLAVCIFAFAITGFVANSL